MKTIHYSMTSAAMLACTLAAVALLSGCPTSTAQKLAPGAATTLDGWPIDADGWSTFTPTRDTRIIYVSASEGDDANDGLSEQMPKATIEAGLALMRSGKPDWLLLKRGDAWPTTKIVTWLEGGVSKTAPMLFGSYGTGPRPKLFAVKHQASAQYVVLRDLHFVAAANLRDQDFYVENCWFGGTDVLISDPDSAMFYPGCNNVVISRCIFDDHYYNGGGSKTGMYYGRSGLTLINCYFFGNRDRDRRQDEVTWGNTHALYCQVTATDVKIDNCVVFMLSLGGITTRGPGTITDCLSYRAGGSAGGIGHLYEWQEHYPEGVTGLSARNINIKNPMVFTNTASSGLTVRDNIVIGPLGEYGLEIGSECRGGLFLNNIVYNGQWNIYSGTNLTMTGNILWRDGDAAAVGWARALKQNTGTSATWSATTFFNGSPANPSFIYWHGGAYQDVATWENASGATESTYGAPAFVDAERGLKSYLEGLGFGPYADEGQAWHAFVDIMRAQDRTTWDSRFEAEAINAHIRLGFNY